MKQSNDLQQGCHTFIVRLWRVGERGVWRATLKSGDSGKQTSFTSLPLLVDSLQEQAKTAAMAERRELI